MHAFLLAFALTAPPARVDARQALAQGIALFDNFEDAKAQAALSELLRHSPPRAVAGKAHLYLGLIAMNQVDTDRAIEEFKTALMVDPGLDFVRNGSPKARLAFEEARHALEGQLRGSEASPSPQPATPAPSAAVTEPPAAKPSSSHALAITLGAVGLVLAGVGAYGGVDLLEYNNSVGATHGFKAAQLTPGLQSSESQASFWAVAWIPFVVAGALGLTGGALTW